jgi:hypothetical protein
MQQRQRKFRAKTLDGKRHYFTIFQTPDLIESGTKQQVA